MRESLREVLASWADLSKPKGLPRLQEVLNPAVLLDLDTEEMEALLGKLPQVGALEGRDPGGLRVVSLGFHAHIQGKDPRCPYPVDFFVRLGGVLSALNLVLRIPIELTRLRGLESMPVGADLISALQFMNTAGLSVMDAVELVFQRMYRPGVPNCFQWSIPGGIQDLTEDAETRGLQELAEEAQGLRVVASRMLLQNRVYQSGNLPEFHSVQAVLCVGEPKVSTVAAQEGISQYHFVRLCDALRWFNEQYSASMYVLDANYPDSKAEHALLMLLHLCQQNQIR